MSVIFNRLTNYYCLLSNDFLTRMNKISAQALDLKSHRIAYTPNQRRGICRSDNMSSLRNVPFSQTKISASIWQRLKNAGRHWFEDWFRSRERRNLWQKMTRETNKCCNNINIPIYSLLFEHFFTFALKYFCIVYY